VARAAKLERFAPGILIAIDGYLDLVEPHLDEILERLDAIEPVLPFALANLDLIAPHCGVLLEHFDVLMLYADEGGRYLDELIEYLPRYAPKLDVLGPALALVRPHLDRILPHLGTIAPYAERFAPYMAIAANADILLFYLGWILRIPVLGGWTLRLPLMPRVANFLAQRLPRRPVRGRTWDYECTWEPRMRRPLVGAAAAATTRDERRPVVHGLGGRDGLRWLSHWVERAAARGLSSSSTLALAPPRHSQLAPPFVAGLWLCCYDSGNTMAQVQGDLRRARRCVRRDHLP